MKHHIFKVLADETRLDIIELLSQESSMTISEVAENFKISRQAVTKHLDVMQQADVISVETVGRERHCTLNPETLKAAYLWLESYSRFWDNQLLELGKHLDKKLDKKK